VLGGCDNHYTTETRDGVDSQLFGFEGD